MAGIQFTGLSSGLDTDAIIKAMLANQQTKIDNATNDKTKLEWKSEQWKKVNDSVNEFYNDYVDKLRYQSTFESYAAVSSSWAVGVKMTGSMPTGTHKIEVKELATEISLSGDISASISSKGKSFNELGLLGEGENSKLTVNGKEIQIMDSDSLTTLEKKIKEVDDSLNINFDINNKKLFISSKETGTKAKVDIQVTSDSTDLFKKIGIASGTYQNEGGDIVTAKGVCDDSGKLQLQGTGARYIYNGVELDSDTNDVEVNGIKLTLKEKTPENSPVIIDVTYDADSVVNFISGFVDAYNQLIDDLNKQYNATKVSLSPLTDEQKVNMTEKQIDDYEQDIKEALLRRDPSLKKVIDSLRSSMQNVVSGNKFSSLSGIGITTGNYTENGKLKLDEDKLRKALKEDSEAVKELFTGTGENNELSSGTTIAENTIGLGNRLNTTFQDLAKRIDGMKSYQSYYNDKVNQKKIEDITSRLGDLKEKYTKLEEMYYKKFTAMEKAMSMLNSQGSSITQMLGN